jgi:hypothetical protein
MNLAFDRKKVRIEIPRDMVDPRLRIEPRIGMTAKTARRHYQKEGRRQIAPELISPTTANHPSFTTALQLKP